MLLGTATIDYPSGYSIHPPYPSKFNQGFLHCGLWLRNHVLRSRWERLLLVSTVLRLLLLLLLRLRLLPRRRGLHRHLDMLGGWVLPIRRLWLLLLVLLRRRYLLLRRLLMHWLRVGSWRRRLGPVLSLLGVLLHCLLEVGVRGWRRFWWSTGRGKRILAWLLEVIGCIWVTCRGRANGLGSVGLLLRKRKVAHLRGSSLTGRII